MWLISDLPRGVHRGSELLQVWKLSIQMVYGDRRVQCHQVNNCMLLQITLSWRRLGIRALRYFACVAVCPLLLLLNVFPVSGPSHAFWKIHTQHEEPVFESTAALHPNVKIFTSLLTSHSLPLIGQICLCYQFQAACPSLNFVQIIAVTHPPLLHSYKFFPRSRQRNVTYVLSGDLQISASFVFIQTLN